MNDPDGPPCPHGDYLTCDVDGCRPLRGTHAQTCPCDPADRVHVVTDPEDFSQPCPHGDYRSCIVDGCRPFRRVHVPGVIVPPAPQVACMWCGGDSERGQCGPCAVLLEAIQAAPRAGVVAIMDATRAVWAQPSLEGAAKPSSTELPSSEEQPSTEELPSIEGLPSVTELQQLRAAMTAGEWQAHGTAVIVADSDHPIYATRVMLAGPANDLTERAAVSRRDAVMNAAGTAALANAAPWLLEIAAAALTWAGSECETQSTETDDYITAAESGTCAGDTHDEKCPVDIAIRRLAAALAKGRP